MTKLEVGDVIELNSSHTVYAKVPKHFIYTNRKGDFTLDKAAVKLCGELSYLKGSYVVIKTSSDGGSTGMDAYPDGHHVFCEKIESDETRHEVDFYQSGCFTAMIKDIEPVGKAKLKWVFE